MKRILVVDDEPNMCIVLQMLLQDEGYGVVTSSDGAGAIRLLEQGEIVDLIISDLKMPGVDGMKLLEYLGQTDRDIPLILITAYGTIPDAVEAMRKGATDFITKPFNTDLILHKVHAVFQMRTLETDRRLLVERVEDDSIVYTSAEMGRVMEIARKIAGVSTPVLITGESGTGKELVAQAIHAWGLDARPGTGVRPFVRVNCSAIPESLFESELFGYQRGAFTGALKDFKGKIRMAENGTLFLDEIGELPPTLQPKLLHLLEGRSFEPLGSATTIHADCRFICATNRDLGALVREGSFRQDLFYRINALNITVPPLRERRDDILPLLDHCLSRYCQEMGKTVRISAAARRALVAYTWPGNVRELKNMVERLVVLAEREDDVRLRDLPPEVARVDSGEELPANRLESAERQIILETLQATGYNVSRAAEILGIPRSNLRYRIEKYNLRTDS
jgi:DNA-binding NtrC family response regulator